MQTPWLLANAVGGLAFGACVAWNGPLALLTLGLSFGLPQAFAMRGYVHRAWSWAVATALSMLVAWLAGIATVILASAVLQALWSPASAPPAAQTLFGVAGYGAAMLVAGALVGLAQSRLVPRAKRPWVLSTAIGAVAFWVVLVGGLVEFGGGWTATNAFLGGTLDPMEVPLLIGGGALGGVAYGLVTTPTLRRAFADLGQTASLGAGSDRHWR